MRYIFLFIVFFLCISSRSQTQKKILINDSLIGFNINEIHEQAKWRGITSDEMDYFVRLSKREFINTKYNLLTASSAFSNTDLSKIAISYCLNEDFENSSPSTTFPVPSSNTISATNGINGWTSSSGSNYTSVVGSCSLSTCCTNTPNAVLVIGTGTASGYIDPNIGAAYPIFSVFGDSINKGNIVNPISCQGNFFVKLNNNTPGSSVNRITKTFNVQASNSLFKFAAISVGSGPHCCCDNVGVSIKMKDCLGNLLAGPQYSITPNQNTAAGCTSTAVCTSMGGPVTFTPGAVAGLVYTKWKIAAFNLTPYIGTCVTVEFNGIDCPYSGHAGYGYFDAQCDSMYILANSNRVGAIADTLIINSCVTVTDTLKAPDGLEPYIWTGPIGFTTATTQSITTNFPGTYTLSMSGFGPYPPSYKYIILSHSVTAISVSSTNTIICQGDSAILNATGVSTYTWNTGANTSSIIVTPSVTTTYTVNSINVKGCPAKGIYTQSVSLCTGVNATTEYLSHFSIQPNPNNGEFIILMKIKEKNVVAQIYNAFGQLILKKPINEERTLINITEQSNGVYSVKLFNNDRLLFATKIIKVGN